MRLRRAKVSDVGKLYEMARDDLARYSWFHKEALVKNVNEEPKLCFVLEHDKKVAGALFFRQEWNDVVWGWLAFVENHMRHKGVAAGFERDVLKTLKKMKYDILYAEVDARNIHMLRWCGKNGYRKVCTFPDWFGRGRNAIIFRKNIV